jgi:chlorobactene glucosyltransferase
MIDYLIWILVITHCSFLFIVVYNYFTAPRLTDLTNFPNFDQRLSICIPVRNEERNIRECLFSILDQSYKNFEALILNDQSHDDTAEIVKEIALSDSRVKLIEGETLPDGWLGKNWACHQLAGHASGRLLLFVDADVRFDQNAILSALGMFIQKRVKMLSVFPTQIIRYWRPRLLVPSMNWLLLTFLPLRKVYSGKSKSFVAANGQFILIEKSIYEEIGGHERLKSEIVEDMELARSLKSAGHKMITALGHDTLSCEMYNSFKQSFKGFSKNFYPGFNINPYLFIIFMLCIQLIFFSPTVLWVFNMSFLYILPFIILSRILIARMSKQDAFSNILLHPAQIFLILFVGIYSVFVTQSGRVKWKGREI